MRGVQDYPPLGRLIEIGGRAVHALTRGRGPDVILIHGASGNLRDFTFGLMGRLARRYRVTAFDRPGLGHSAALHGGGESPAEQAAVLEAAAAGLGLGPAMLLGHSYGAAVALAWALDFPARAAALVSLAGVSHPWEGGLGAWYALASTSLGGMTLVPVAAALAPEWMIDRALAGIFDPDPMPEGYADHIGLPLILRSAQLHTNARQVSSLKPHVAAMAPRYPGLAMPVEILHGDADTVVPLHVHAAPLAARVPGAELTVLPGIGHMPHHADPAATVAAVDRAAARAGLR